MIKYRISFISSVISFKWLYAQKAGKPSLIFRLNSIASNDSVLENSPSADKVICPPGA